MLCDYIYLDTDERRRFAQVSHEYLIEQLQYSNKVIIGKHQLPENTPQFAITGTGQYSMKFNHPVKEIIWLINEMPDPSSEHEVIAESAFLQLNGTDRMSKRHGTYYTLVQRYQNHSGAHLVNMNGSMIDTGIHIYSFGLHPENHQPSGTCNFSRIDSAVLHLEYKNVVIGNLD